MTRTGIRNNIHEISPILTQGVILKSVFFTFTRPEIQDILQTFLGSTLNRTGTSGSGLMKFVGQTNENKTIFIGFCQSTQSYALRFFKEDGLNVFENFRTNLLFSEDFLRHLDDFTMTYCESDTIFVAPTPFTQSREFILGIEDLVRIQQRSVPRLTLEAGQCFIGGKSGNNSVCIQAQITPTSEITNLVLRHKARGPGAGKILNLLKENQSLSFEACIAYTILQVFSKISSNSLLEVFRNDYLRRYSFGVVVTTNQSTTRLSTGGKYVQRSLKAITNKLANSSTSMETQTLILEWARVVTENQTNIRNGPQFMVSFLQALRNTQSSLPAASAITTNESSSPSRRKRTETES